jgi:DNA polymerase III subunit gamma/tau
MAKKAVPPAETPPDVLQSDGNAKYTVVARRYRPKTFSELVGQSTVAQALLSAIQSNRVGHAYLFTGARGVGKTSTARIFAKALNASADTNGQFDPSSDIAQAIDAGEDMDVLEIDGASNRGIDEIRQLRANAAVRPSRSRYKIYIIDEVHMLTTPAFHALLKTLEEPPGHVKFIFCTTDPEKIPITVLSRCQRFDFPPVHTEQIYERLKFICDNEGTKADESALRLIARRAAGSMRDSQSLLEQLLSFGGDSITAESVHAMLGTADETRLAAFASRLIERDAGGALRELDSAASQGVDMGQLAEQLLGYLRDMMTVTVGGGSDLIRTANPNNSELLMQWGKTWGTMTLLSALQLLDETIVKMRHSVQSRVLLEIALVQICNLQDLQSLSDLVKAFSTGTQAPAPRVLLPSPSDEPKKKVELVDVEWGQKSSTKTDVEKPAIPITPIERTASSTADVHGVAPSVIATSVTEPIEQLATAVTRPGIGSEGAAESTTEKPKPPQENASPQGTLSNLELFQEVANSLGGFAKQCSELAVRIESPHDHQWKVCLARDGSIIRDYFTTGDNSKRLTQAVQRRLAREIVLSFELTNEPSQSPAASIPIAEDVPSIARDPSARSVPQAQLIRSAMTHPLVKKFMEVFDGQIVRVDAPRVQLAAPHFPRKQTSESASSTDADG